MEIVGAKERGKIRAPPPVVQLCTGDVRRRFCGGGAWISRPENRVKSGNRCRISVESMSNRCQIDPALRRGKRGGFDGEVSGVCA